MNTPIYLGWTVTFLATLLLLHRWVLRRERTRRVARGLRAYASGAQLV